MKNVSIYRSDLLKPEQAGQIAALLHAVWPDATKNLDEYARSLIESKEIKRVYVIWDGGKAIATAQTFPRTIRYEGGTLEVVALAAVCVHESCRGLGYGEQLVREVFKTIDEASSGVVLFQTGVPGFYQKLGAVAIENPFWNSTGSDPTRSPWWDQHVMIYSKNTRWPSGPIDLNGSGY